MKWKPDLRIGMWVGSGIILAILLVDAGLLLRTIYGPLNGVSFVCALLVLLSLLAIGAVGYRIYDLRKLRYEFDRNQLTIVTAASNQIVPMDRIQQVIEGRDAKLQKRMLSLTWPGCFIGRGQIQEIGLTLFYAATPLSGQAIVVTPTLAYGISVPDMEAFMEVFNANRRIGSSTEVVQESHRAAYTRWHIWTDHLAHGILLGSIVLNLALFAILCFRYPRLAHLLPLHYDLTGRVDRIAPRSQVFALPIIGLITWAANGVLGTALYRRERVASYLAWGGALLVQILFLLALWNIVS
ncbi:MAG: DUF1648 domain-containing protein [Anaerolineae bacterium]|nr:DUF1648 domain-containing protein [Anaerolineae bacterium]